MNQSDKDRLVMLDEVSKQEGKDKPRHDYMQNKRQIEALLADIPLLDCWVAHLYREWATNGVSGDSFQQLVICLFETFKQEHEELASLMFSDGCKIALERIDEGYRRLGRPEQVTRKNND